MTVTMHLDVLLGSLAVAVFFLFAIGTFVLLLLGGRQR